MFASFVSGNGHYIIIKWVGLPKLGGSPPQVQPETKQNGINQTIVLSFFIAMLQTFTERLPYLPK